MIDPEPEPPQSNAGADTNLKKIETEEADKMKKTASDLEDAKKEIKTLTDEKTGLEVKLKNCKKADEEKKQLREEVQNQNGIISKLEKKNEELQKQLKFQGKNTYIMLGDVFF